MAAPSLDDKLREIIKEQDNLKACCHGIASDIQLKTLLFVDLIDKLRFALTDQDPQVRCRGTQVLACVLQSMPLDFLQEDELHYISTFLSDRLKDHHSVIPAVLQGILAIVAMRHLPDEAPVLIMTTMFREISCQSQLHSERKVIYSILNTLTLNKSDDLKKMGPDLIAGVIQFIDGERDPRNLLFLFNMLPVFVETFPLGHLTGEVFDVMSCYFPVDFSPPANDPNAVRREDLANSLAHCLVAIPPFAEYCLPLLMEKLDSSVRVAKLDSLHVLEEACLKFSVEDMETHLKFLWKSILKEILPGTDKDVQDAAIPVLKALIRKLSADAVDKDQSKLLIELLTQTIGASQNFLSEVDSTLFVSAAKMLLASARASSFSCHFIITRVLPELIEQCLKKPNPNVLSNVLLTISNFLEVCHEVRVDITEALPDWSQCLPGLFLSAASESMVENGRLGMEGWRGLTLTVPLLTCSSTASLPAQASPPSQEHVYQLICQTLEEAESVQIRNSCMECLKAQAKHYPKEVMDLIVKKLIPDLDDEQLEKGSEDFSKYQALKRRRWSSMCELACCVGEPFTSYVIPKVISAVINLSSCHEGGKSSVGISCLKKAIELAETNRDSLCEYLNSELCAPAVLINWWLRGVVSVRDVEGHPMDSAAKMFEDCSLLNEVATLVSLIVRTVSSSAQASLILRLLPLFFHWSFLNEKCLEEADLPKNIKLLDESSPWQQTQTVILVEALIGSLRREQEVCDALSNVGIMELFEQLLSLAIFNPHPPTRLSSSRLLGCLINKLPEEMHLTKLLADLKAAVTPVLEDSIIPDWQRISSVKLHVWVTKALLLRGHEDADIWIERLIGILGKEKIGIEAAVGFQEIMNQSEGYLNSDCHAQIRILYRQRFYLTLPKLVESYRKASLSTRGNFLLALAHLMSGVPRSLLLDDLPDIIPLLVESLKQPHSGDVVDTIGIHDGQEEKLLLISTLETLNDILMSLNTTLSEHLQTFIPKLLNIARSSKHMVVRQKALSCIYHFTKYPTILLLPFKYKVIQGLAPCLDDPKRLVRQDAVRARCQWFLVGAPG
ncbi:MMS19 nucleotide excision repair protein homolog isoform X2 [Ischnura elegans]|uniref:MMS19 nucleotide excision repair protein homolog isoform X2 n=1 Tax=Ischnura elegans TaxID=197161 RepID=UPI001ED87F1B|nr:MMS19 nucleotide excision repair protein homolog isoform X2 [Ischnura elegans]